MIVFPAVDILGGQCVQLRRGDPEASKVYYRDPVEAAQRWVSEGAEVLHVVDLDAALGTGSNAAGVQRVCAAVEVPVQVAGGVRDATGFQAALDAGASRVVLGTAAVATPDLVEALASAHEGKVVVAADVKQGEVVIKGWTQGTGVSLAELASRVAWPGVAALLVTDVGRDGMLVGPNLDLYRELVGLTDRPILASGGVRNRSDLDALEEVGCAGAVVGTALYEGQVTLR